MFATRRSRLWRLILSHLLWDQDALDVTASEVRDWKLLALDAISLVSNDLYMRTGSLDSAVQFAMRQVLAELDCVSIPNELGGKELLEAEAEMARRCGPDEVEIRLLINILGRFHDREGLQRCDVVRVDRRNALRYIRSGIAQLASEPGLGVAYAVRPNFTEAQLISV